MKLDSFEVINKLGRGGYSHVYLAKSKKKVADVANNQLVALKVISKIRQRSVMREIRVRWLFHNLKLPCYFMYIIRLILFINVASVPPIYGHKNL